MNSTNKNEREENNAFKNIIFSSFRFFYLLKFWEHQWIWVNKINK